MAWASIPICILLRPGDWGAKGRGVGKGNREWGVGKEALSSPHSLLPTLSSSVIQLFQFLHRLIIALEPSFVRAERRRMVDAAAVDGARAVFHMKHFVVQYEFNQVFRDRG